MSLNVGEVFTAEISMVIGSGIGCVKNGHDTITVGPVNCEKGTQVQLKYLGEEDQDGSTPVQYALCLNDTVTADNYDEYIRKRLNDLIPDKPPAQDEVAYAEIDAIEGNDIGVTYMGGEKIHLGPVNGASGDVVKIEGVTDSHAKVLTPDYRGENYETRFNILAQRVHELPVTKGETFTTAVTEIEDETPVGYVGEMPIHFPTGDAAIGQKIDGKITEFDQDKAIGAIVEKYDEVVRVENAGHWARIQWLRQQGFGDDPMRAFATEFLGVEQATLPDGEDQIRDALIAEAIRRGLKHKATAGAESYPRAHVTGIRHWVLHKLRPIIGEPEDDDNWFHDILTDRNEPTLTFYGDLMRLSNGYYAPGPTRAVLTGDSEAVLVSGQPSEHFLAQGLDLEFRGISRVITNTSEADLAAADITVQPLTDYIGEDTVDSFDAAYLQEFIKIRDTQPWQPEADWEAYLGNVGYGITWGDDPYQVTQEDETTLSLWRNPVEYGPDDYWIKITPDDDIEDAKMVRVPNRYYKQVCFVLDRLGGLPRSAQFSTLDDGIRLSCDFAPPRAQMRWLNAIGAKWEKPKHNKIHWQFDAEDKESVEQAFGKLAVDIKASTAGLLN